MQLLGYSMSSVDGIISTQRHRAVRRSPGAAVLTGHDRASLESRLHRPDPVIRFPPTALVRPLGLPRDGEPRAAPRRPPPGWRIALPHTRSGQHRRARRRRRRRGRAHRSDGKQIVPAVSTCRAPLPRSQPPAALPAAAFTVPGKATTVVVLRNPAAGTWRVAAAPGSPAIAGRSPSHTRCRTLRFTGGSSDTGAGCAWPTPASATGHDRFVRRARRPVFCTRSGRPVAIGRNGRHSLPADGPAGTRRIVALIDTGRPAAPARRARDLQGARAAARRPSSQAARQHPPPHAERSASGPRATRTAIGSGSASTDGKHRLMLASATHRSVRLTGLGPGAAATATVTAIAADGDSGPTVTGRAGRA